MTPADSRGSRRTHRNALISILPPGRRVVATPQRKGRQTPPATTWRVLAGIGGGKGIRLKTKTRTRDQRVKEMIAAAPVLFQKMLRDAYSGIASKRRAIQANCLTCTHYDRKLIADCRVWSCCLWPFRPYQEKQK
jgi:hypothetical protein